MKKINVKGMTEFFGDGRAAVSLFNNADVSTLLHESAHVMRRHLKPEDLHIFEQWLGVQDDNWLVNHEERFARGMERFFWDGVLIPTELGHLSEALRAIYPRVEGSTINVELPDEIRLTYARMFGFTQGEDKLREVDRAHVTARNSGTRRSPVPWFEEPTLLLCIASTLAVAIGLLPLSYGYFVLLRFVLCLTAVYGFVRALSSSSEQWKWAYGSIAILYNPILPVHLREKTLWIGVNLVTLAVLWYGRYSLSKHKELADGR